MAVSSSPEILGQVEKIVVPVIIYTLENKVIGRPSYHLELSNF